MERLEAKKRTRKRVREKPNLVGWSITDITRRQIQKIAAMFRVKKVKAIHKMFDILFSELVGNKEFQNFVEMYDYLQEKELAAETSIYSSFDMDKDYMEKFKDTMFNFGFSDRSPFLRIVVDYIYQKHCEPLTNILAKLKNDLKDRGYKVKNIVPALMGDIFIQVESPLKASGTRRR